MTTDLHHGEVPAFDPALVDLLTRTVEQEYDAANAAGGEWGPCYPAPRTLAVALAQALGVAGVRNLVRSSTSGDGLHHCARCGIELDSDDRDDLCEECDHLVFPPEKARCSFALGRGMYCTRGQDHEGRHAPDRAPVNGPPFGTIAWDEHCDAWAVYASRHRGQDALTIAARGGFGLWELCDQLGRAPQTWQPSFDTREGLVDAMKRLTAAPLPEVIPMARAIEHDRTFSPDHVREEKADD